MAKCKTPLIEKDLIFKENFQSLNQAFDVMADKLYKKGLVKLDYLESIKKREQDFPTGIDLSVISEDFPNVAIPHTESEYCNSTNVILVKLEKKIIVKNMMDSKKDLKVKYLFMILNEAGGEQANVLSDIMGFVTDKNNIRDLEKANTIEELYETAKKLNL